MTPPLITPTTALLVVDVQNDFCPNGALAVPRGDEIIPLINRLMPNFGCVAITQDYHPAGHISFASNHDLAEYSTITLPYGEQVLWPDHCIQGTFGAKLHADLNTDFAKIIIKKGTRNHIDSYSAFLEADGKTPTGLAGYLKENNINQVFITGLATDFCVAWTAMDARLFGFDTWVIEDACRAIDVNGSLNDAWQQMNALGIQKIDSTALLNQLAPHSSSA